MKAFNRHLNLALQFTEYLVLPQYHSKFYDLSIHRHFGAHRACQSAHQKTRQVLPT